MARYIENLNECTDPVSGDYMWLVDASAGSTDKDRKVDVAKFPRLAIANTFAAAQTATAWYVNSANNSIYSDAALAFSMNGEIQTLADNAVLSLANAICVLLVTDITNGNIGIFALRGGVNGTQELLDPSGVFSTTKDTASSFNIYYDSGYKLQNKRGGSRNFSLIRLGR